MSLDHSTYAVVLAGGRGSRLRELTEWRAKPAMPFGGQMKIIDFTLSNCINSGVRRIGVLTQYKSQSLIRHITRGWGFLDARLGEFIDVVPAQQRVDQNWYSGTANAVWQNLDMLQEAQPRRVLVLAGDHVYKMDYSRLLADHVEGGHEVTVSCIEVPLDQACAYGVLQTTPEGLVTAFEEKPAVPKPAFAGASVALVSMGIYVFEANTLYAELKRDASESASQHDFGHDLLPRLVEEGRVRAHPFSHSCVNMVEGRPYWRDVGTLDAYWEANMDLIKPLPELNLYDERWPIRSLGAPLAPAKFVLDLDGRRGTAIDSLVSSGCIVSGGSVRRSVLFANTRIEEGSQVEDSLVLHGAVVGRGSTVRNAIIDKGCLLPDQFTVGVDVEKDRAQFTVTGRGIVLVTQAMLERSGLQSDPSQDRPMPLAVVPSAQQV